MFPDTEQCSGLLGLGQGADWIISSSDSTDSFPREKRCSLSLLTACDENGDEHLKREMVTHERD